MKNMLMFIIALMCVVNNCLSQNHQSSDKKTLSVIDYADSGKILNYKKLNNEEAISFDMIAHLDQSEAERIVIRGYFYKQDVLHTIQFDTDNTSDSNLCRVETNVVEPHLGVGASTAEVYPGIIVDEVSEESAAGQAGLHEDVTIISYNGIDLGSFCDLSHSVKSCAPGQTVDLLVQEGDDLKTMSVTLGKREKVVITLEECQDDANPEFELEANHIHSEQFDVFPNPTNGKITIDFKSQKSGSGKLAIVDASGKVIYTQDIEDVQEGKSFKYIFENENPGIYYVILETQDSIEKEKIIFTRN